MTHDCKRQSFWADTLRMEGGACGNAHGTHDAHKRSGVANNRQHLGARMRNGKNAPKHLVLPQRFASVGSRLLPLQLPLPPPCAALDVCRSHPDFKNVALALAYPSFFPQACK